MTPEEQHEQLRLTRQICLANAEAFLTVAERELGKGSDHICFHLALLALEEIGKALLATVNYLAITGRSDKHDSTVAMDDHVKKLFWALWGGSMLRDSGFTKESIDQNRHLATTLHERRLESLYTDTRNPLPIGERTEEGEAKRLVDLTRARLEIERAQELAEWRYRNFSGTVSGAGSNITFTVRASMDYTILVNGVTDELGTTLTLNGTTASATYGGTVASQSYRSGKRYIAGSTSGGTVTAGADGYVNRVSSALTISATATQSVDFGTADVSSLNESGLLFGTKITARRSTYATNPTYANITGATVTSGDGGGISCTDNADGTYSCSVPLAHTDTTAQATGSSLLTGGTGSPSCIYTDRTAGGDAQSTCTITITDSAPGVIPLWALRPPSLPGPPSPLPGATATLFRRANNPRVYVQRTDGLLYWVKTLQDFNAAGYQWKDVQVVSQPTFSQLSIGGTVRVIQGIGYLRIRELPSLSGSVVGRTMSNEEWTFTAIDHNWYRVQKNGKNVGWVFGDYVSEF